MQVVQVLRDARAILHLQDQVGWTALHCGVQNGHQGVVQALVEDRNFAEEEIQQVQRVRADDERLSTLHLSPLIDGH